jgi:hypothetical protein
LIAIHPIYNNSLAPIAGSFDYLNSTPDELRTAPIQPDFSVDNRTCWKTTKKIALIILKIALFPWIIYEAIRWTFQRLAMTVIYPAQSIILRYCGYPQFKTEQQDLFRSEIPSHMPPDSIIRHIVLEKDGTSYSGLMLSCPETIQNGKWAIQALGNCETVEQSIHRYSHYKEVEYNLIMINGPGVGRSEGTATAQTMGEAQEMGISYLEQVIQANHIVIAGFSLGGGAIGRAIIDHTFLEDKKYLVIQQMTFDKLSNLAHSLSSPCTAPITRCMVHWTGIEQDNTAASKKLTELGIPEVVIQAGIITVFQHDGVIPPEATHGHALVELGLNDEKTICRTIKGRHNEGGITETVEFIRSWELHPHYFFAGN